jgi:outer membrane receptor protein involved in Fe transport
MLGHFDYLVNPQNQFSLTLNTTPAITEVANRTGLSSHYAPVGQGFGYGGARDANGFLPGWSATSPGLGSTLGAFVPGLASQQQDGQDDYQIDNNTFGLLNFRHTFDANTTGLISFTQTLSTTQLRNNNPANTILNSVNPDGTLTTTDNSIEFNPVMTRQYNQSQLQGNLTKSQGVHTFKAGAIYDDQRGDESYQFTPQSQLALDALANIYSFAQNPANVVNPLLPAGSYNGATDALGNPVWTMAQAGEAFPTLHVHKTGYYGAAYLQDTWNATSRFTMNYGLRLDTFHQKNALSNTLGYTSTSSLTTTKLSPRLNTAYALPSRTILRLSYDKLFTQPPLAQGAILGQVIHPEIIDQYESSVEKQLTARQTAKVAYYYKEIHNQDDTGILIPFTQIGALTTLNYQYASVHGLEVSYDLTPRGNIGPGGFLAYTYSIAKPGGLNEAGTPAPIINDHNQWDTLTTGVNYTWKSQAYASTTFYYGSGEASSALGTVGPVGPDGAPTLGNGKPIPRTQVDLRFASSPKMLGIGGLQLDVINLFDSRKVDNFNSGFSGTRFQQGRNILVTMNSKF